VRRAGGNPILLENAVDTDAFVSSRSSEARIVAFVGTVCERKGLDDLRRALLLLRDADDPTLLPLQVVIVGDGSQEGPDAFERVRAAYAASGLLDLVRFVGALPRESVRAELARASVFCLPSHWEGLPISMLEAMAAGCAIIASRVGEIPAVLDGYGIVVDPHDPSGLASAIGGVMADTDQRVRLGIAARKRVRARYGLDAMRERLLAIYEDLGYSR
jgi:glycosyltransferase involved in cell wall biosynthesis